MTPSNQLKISKCISNFIFLSHSLNTSLKRIVYVTNYYFNYFETNSWNSEMFIIIFHQRRLRRSVGEPTHASSLCNDVRHGNSRLNSTHDKCELLNDLWVVRLSTRRWVGVINLLRTCEKFLRILNSFWRDPLLPAHCWFHCFNQCQSTDNTARFKIIAWLW